MKRTPFSILGLFLSSFILLTFITSCEVEHFYNAEITVVDALGEPKPGFTVTTTVNVDADYEPSRNGISDEMGKVFFEFKNVAILKVQADSIVDGGNNYHGESLLVLEEDKTVPITVVVYN